MASTRSADARTLEALDLSDVHCTRQTRRDYLYAIAAWKVGIFNVCGYNKVTIFIRRHTYRCARSSRWGDRLPIRVEENITSSPKTDEKVTES